MVECENEKGLLSLRVVTEVDGKHGAPPDCSEGASRCNQPTDDGYVCHIFRLPFLGTSDVLCNPHTPDILHSGICCEYTVVCTAHMPHVRISVESEAVIGS